MAYNAGFDLGTLAPLVTNFLEDHVADLKTYMTDQVCRAEKVDNPTGVIERWETPVGMASGEGTSSKHAPGTASPKGNTALGTRNYTIDSFSWSEPINHLAKRALESRKGQFSALAGRSAHQVQKDKDLDLASILKGNGTLAKSNDLTGFPVGTAWDNIAGTPITDIDTGILSLRGAQNGLICIAGWDVLLDLSKNPEVVNDADKSFEGVAGVIEKIVSRGISKVYVDYNPFNVNASGQARDYKGLLDGVFYIGTRNNLVKVYMNPLAMDVYADDDTRTQYLRASEDCVIITEYAEHGYAYTGIQT